VRRFSDSARRSNADQAIRAGAKRGSAFTARVCSTSKWDALTLQFLS